MSQSVPKTSSPTMPQEALRAVAEALARVMRARHPECDWVAVAPSSSSTRTAA